LRGSLERKLGARVVRATTEAGGFSPGVASRLELSDGRRVFAKVVGKTANPDSPGVHRAEAQILAQMPSNAPVPRLLSTYDDGDWVALFLEEVKGRTPRLPWNSRELNRVVQAIESLAELFTPAPFAAPTLKRRYRGSFTRWRELAEAHRRGIDSLLDLDPWARGHLAGLVELEERFPLVVKGSTLLHFDLRADNILVTRDRIFFVDWPWACVGAEWIDLAGFLPSVAMQGGPSPWTIFDKSRLARGAKTDDVNSVLAALTGFLLGNARKPPPPGLSTLRPFQRAQGVEALAWLRHRLDQQ
jgi:aminoglycoside phosphotransferase